MSNEINDGGPAFPFGKRIESYDSTTGILHGISECHHPGMSLRDWFAGQATDEDLWPHHIGRDHHGNIIGTREEAKYRYADAMLAARKKGPTQ